MISFRFYIKPMCQGLVSQGIQWASISFEPVLNIHFHYFNISGQVQNWGNRTQVVKCPLVSKKNTMSISRLYTETEIKAYNFYEHSLCKVSGHVKGGIQWWTLFCRSQHNHIKATLVPNMILGTAVCAYKMHFNSLVLPYPILCPSSFYKN